MLKYIKGNADDVIRIISKTCYNKVIFNEYINIAKDNDTTVLINNDYDAIFMYSKKGNVMVIYTGVINNEIIDLCALLIHNHFACYHPNTIFTDNNSVEIINKAKLLNGDFDIVDEEKQSVWCKVDKSNYSNIIIIPSKVNNSDKVYIPMEYDFMGEYLKYTVALV